LELLQAENGVSSAETADAYMLLPLVFMVIVGTVILQGGTAKLLARLLKVERQEPQGALFVGANEPARFIARYLHSQGVYVLLVDTSNANITDARREGLRVYEGNILKDNIIEELDTGYTGRLIALTPNSEINMLAC